MDFLDFSSVLSRAREFAGLGRALVGSVWVETESRGFILETLSFNTSMSSTSFSISLLLSFLSTLQCSSCSVTFLFSWSNLVMIVSRDLIFFSVLDISEVNSEIVALYLLFVCFKLETS